MDESDRHILLARFAALKALAMALIDTHPDKSALGKNLSEITDSLMGEWLNSALSDQFVAEFQTQMEALQKRCQSS